MASSKLTQEEETKYITYVIYGNKWLEKEAGGDAAKEQKLRLEIEEIGKKRVNFSEVSALVAAVIDILLNPSINYHTKRLLLEERVIKNYAVNKDSLTDLAKELHKNGDLSDKSYQYIKKHSFAITQDSFKHEAKALDDEEKKSQAAVKKAEEKLKHVANDNKTTLASGVYDSNSDNNVIKLKKRGK